MPSSPNKLSHFWHELKRRNVHRLLAIYAGTAYVIFEASTIIFPRWGLPDWTIDLVLYLLILGAIITFVISWIYDITPEGVQKTKPFKQQQKEEQIKVSGAWRIATYVSILIILVLVAFNIFGEKRGAGINESLAKSIAVLPFHNYSGDPKQDNMCEGLTDEIITHLFKIRSFDEVRPLTSVLPYRDSEKGITEIAQALEVNYILAGSYKKMGEKLKITARLIESKSDNHIWIKDYELPYNEVMGIPGQIAIQIANHLKAFISNSENDRITATYIPRQEALELIQKSKSSYNSGESATRNDRINWAVNAMTIDPEYADAYAWVGYLIFREGNLHGNKGIQEVAWEALNYFEKALDLDPYNATAHFGMYNINEYQKYDYIAAEKEIVKAIDLEPNNPLFVGPYSHFLVKRCRFEESISWHKKAIDLSPEPDSTLLMWYYTLSGNYNEALNIGKTIQRNNASPQGIEGLSYIHMEMYDSALYYLESSTNQTRSKACKAIANFHLGNVEAARLQIDELKTMSDTTNVGSPAFFIGFYYSSINESDSAFYWLEKAYANHSAEYAWLKAYPEFQNIKNDNRYRDLYERTGHKAYDDYMASREKY